MAHGNEEDLLVWKDWCVEQLGPEKMIADIDRADIEELITRRRRDGTQILIFESKVPKKAPKCPGNYADIRPPTCGM